MKNNKYHTSRRSTPWDNKKELEPIETFIRSNYLEYFDYHHKKVIDTDESILLNTYTPVACPRCLSTNFKKNGSYESNLQKYYCNNCKKNFNILTGTLFEDHKIPILEWIEYILEIISYDVAYYDEATGTVTFASDKYSVFTLVPLTKSNNQYDPIEVEPDVPAESESEASSEGSDEPAVLKTSGETSDNTYIVIEQQEINRNPETIIIDAAGVDKTGLESMPKQTYNLSSFVTAKGFMASIDKIAKSNQEKGAINIYTERPICFTNEILQNMSKNNIDFVYYFKHKGYLYSVTIPAQIDLEAIFKNNKYAGPLYLGYVLGNSKLIK